MSCGTDAPVAGTSPERWRTQTMPGALPAALLEAEWLEADGLGGFASGTVAGIRTRR
jgi:hypothetical protein